jgi:signal transduction histidine kinase
MLLTSSEWAGFVKFERRDWSDILAIYYFRYRSYILILLTALVVGLVLVNYYRRRTRRNLEIIRDQKEELERAQEELRKAQAQLVAQEKFRQARDIAGGFAHEIRNALSPGRNVLGRMIELDREKLSDDKLRRMSRLIDRSLAHAVALTERISEYSHIEDLEATEQVDLALVLDRVLKEHEHLLRDRDIKVSRSGAESLPYEASPRHFELVFANLIRNAVEAMSEGDQRNLKIALNQSSDGMTIEIADTGPGIDDDDLDRIWDIFFTTNPDTGTGVGLTLTRKIVEMYDGSISVDSCKGQGTTFRIELPVKRA